MEFREIGDFEWEVVRPFLPPRFRVGRPRAGDRMVLNGILYVLTSDCRWCDMPVGYGSYKTGGGLGGGRRWVYGTVFLMNG